MKNDVYTIMIVHFLFFKSAESVAGNCSGQYVINFKKWLFERRNTHCYSWMELTGKSLKVFVALI